MFYSANYFFILIREDMAIIRAVVPDMDGSFFGDDYLTRNDGDVIAANMTILDELKSTL